MASASATVAIASASSEIISPKKKVFIYCRVSTVGQQKGISLDAQAQECRKALDDLKVSTIPCIVQEVGSVRSTVLPHLLLLRNKKNIVVVVYSVDRFCRNVESGWNTLAQMMKNGHTVMFVREGLLITPNTYEALLPRFTSALEAAQIESNAISDRIRMTKAQYIAQGFHVGQVPFGHTALRDQNGRKRLIPENREQLVISFIKLCSTIDTQVATINAVLSQLSASAHIDPIVVEFEGAIIKKLRRPLSIVDITFFLTEYGVPYRNEKSWTTAIVSRILRRANGTVGSDAMDTD